MDPEGRGKVDEILELHPFFNADRDRSFGCGSDGESILPRASIPRRSYELSPMKIARISHDPQTPLQPRHDTNKEMFSPPAIHRSSEFVKNQLAADDKSNNRNIIRAQIC